MRKRKRTKGRGLVEGELVKTFLNKHLSELETVEDYFWRRLISGAVKSGNIPFLEFIFNKENSHIFHHSEMLKIAHSNPLLQSEDPDSDDFDLYMLVRSPEDTLLHEAIHSWKSHDMNTYVDVGFPNLVIYLIEKCDCVPNEGDLLELIRLDEVKTFTFLYDKLIPGIDFDLDNLIKELISCRSVKILRYMYERDPAVVEGASYEVHVFTQAVTFATYEEVSELHSIGVRYDKTALIEAAIVNADIRVLDYCFQEMGGTLSPSLFFYPAAFIDSTTVSYSEGRWSWLLSKGLTPNKADLLSPSFLRAYSFEGLVYLHSKGIDISEALITHFGGRRDDLFRVDPKRVKKQAEWIHRYYPFLRMPFPIIEFAIGYSELDLIESLNKMGYKWREEEKEMAKATAKCADPKAVISEEDWGKLVKDSFTKVPIWKQKEKEEKEEEEKEKEKEERIARAAEALRLIEESFNSSK